MTSCEITGNQTVCSTACQANKKENFKALYYCILGGSLFPTKRASTWKWRHHDLCVIMTSWLQYFSVLTSGLRILDGWDWGSVLEAVTGSGVRGAQRRTGRKHDPGSWGPQRGHHSRRGHDVLLERTYFISYSSILVDNQIGVFYQYQQTH